MLIRRVVNAVVKRIPAHAADRAQEALLPLRPFERMAAPREAALSVICDDGEQRDLEIVEALEQLGVKGVFAVSPDLVGRPGFLSYAELRTIHAAGHEIAFHGNTHDPFTGFADPRLLDGACRAGTERLRDEGLGPITTVVYPFGKNNRAVRERMSRLFGCGFSTWFGLNAATVNRYAIRRIPFGAYTAKLPATPDWYRGLIDRSAAGSHWPALMLHPGAAEHTAAHTRGLRDLIEHALQRGVPVRTARELGPTGGAAAAASTATREQDAHAGHAHD